MCRLASLLSLMLAAAVADGQSLTFGRWSSAVGDVIDQDLQVEMRVEQSSRQGAEVVDSTTNVQQRKQLRRVTATRVEDGRVTAARVHFYESVATDGDRTEQQPVVGKDYLVTRDGEQLVVTTEDGATPSLQEYSVVAQAMATLGTPSPLAAFLADRTMSVGERLELPAELAHEAIGFNRDIGEVELFALTLKAIEPGGVAHFTAEIEATGHGQQMRLAIDGDFRIEATSSRVLSADLSGPLAMSVVAGEYTLDARGKLRFAVASQHHDAPRDRVAAAR